MGAGWGSRAAWTGRLVLVAAVFVGGACFGSGGGDGPGKPSSEVTRPRRGGVARVGVWFRPEHDQPTFGGAAVRALVLPQLFVAAPDGTWRPSLVEPGSDVTAPDALSASFRLRPGAVWSDGTAISGDDLRRAFDEAAVSAIETPDDGTITVRFSSPLPGWRRLWSFDAAVMAPAVGVWGGPFVMASMTPGLETVLKPNDRWWGEGPFLDEVRLVVVPDTTTSLQLLERGELDVVMPLPVTGREVSIKTIDDVEVATANRSGWWFGLHADPTALDVGDRRALQSTVLRRGFTTGLLRDEATPLDGLAGPEDNVWAAPDPEVASAAGRDAIGVVAREEEPMVGLLLRSMSKRGVAAGWRPELVAADTTEAEAWFADRRYEGALFTLLEPPEMCWRCRWGWFDAGLATAADAGDPAAVRRLEERLRDEAVVLPIWRPRAVVAWRADLHGVAANGFAASAAWNAQEWWREG